MIDEKYVTNYLLLILKKSDMAGQLKFKNKNKNNLM